MMSVNGISLFAGANSYIMANAIPEYLKQKLLELGYDPESVSSKQEALNLIAKAKQDNEKEAVNFQPEQEEIQTDNPLLKKAKELAAKIGINISKEDTLENILSKIQDVLNKLLAAAKDNGDEDLAKIVLGFQHELDRIIEAKNGGGEVENNAVYAVLDAIAEQNKYALGLNN